MLVNGWWYVLHRLFLLNKILILIVGGSIGTVCRYFIATLGQKVFGTWLPFGTLAANLAGCLIMGLLLGVFEARWQVMDEAPYALRLLLFTGFLGALTTFSSVELESLLYLRAGVWERALLYIAGSIVLGLLVMAAGAQAGRWLVRA